ncbi:hypothetical protein V7161_26930 [Neobacillus drentensis]|uniref:hypothetical protein n=1 Tax=Neobacillus drentensis TaxID=220684 RepID=UPI003001B13C
MRGRKKGNHNGIKAAIFVIILFGIIFFLADLFQDDSYYDDYQTNDDNTDHFDESVKILDNILEKERKNGD